jgi:hypothetical protein
MPGWSVEKPTPPRRWVTAQLFLLMVWTWLRGRECVDNFALGVANLDDMPLAEDQGVCLAHSTTGKVLNAKCFFSINWSTSPMSLVGPSLDRSWIRP